MEHYLPEVLFLHFSQMFLLMHRLCPLHWQSTSSGTKRLKYNNNNFINLLKKAFQLNLQCQISKTFSFPKIPLKYAVLF